MLLVEGKLEGKSINSFFKKLSGLSACLLSILYLVACSTPFIKQPIKSFPNEFINTSSALKARDSFDRSSIAIQQGSFSQVVGRIYVRNQNESRERTGRYVEVALNPVSNLSNQWFDQICQKGFDLTGNLESGYKTLIRTSVSNELGQFAFPNVPVGEYYLSARVYWFDDKPLSGPELYGGLLAKKIYVTQAAVSEDLNENHACPGKYRLFRPISIFES
ncbi:hypothetical exported protein [Taylorella equigenitalis 14/56]|uniref:Hypothetical exported protein n=1 Tax=Taylorella equigenitalis 14/56 TaxID=1091497 RepID=I7IAN2_9BURK|nr:carboxypeptidase-like regulatory domain-containing protein [Taylorella equigenitalis]CCG17332.1 hypothetical exported protein [Taylorella equigenitalis 14/56]